MALTRKPLSLKARALQALALREHSLDRKGVGVGVQHRQGVPCALDDFIKALVQCA